MDMIKVSVCCVTYNHGLFLEKAIHSVLNQQFDGVIEMVIGEDCSTDDTRAIALAYQEKFPARIKVLAHATNQGIMANLVSILTVCDGDYICLLDGDDYWTDNLKVQKQVNFLEQNPDFAICAHNLLVVRSDGKQLNELFRPEREEAEYDIRDLALQNMLATASCMYRNVFNAGPNPMGLPAWLLNVKIGDYCLHMLAAQRGKVKYFPAVMGAYRLHEGGAWTGRSEASQLIMYFNAVHYLRQEFTGEIERLLMAQQLSCVQRLAAHGPETTTKFLLEFNEQMQSLLLGQYPFALATLLNECRTEEEPGVNFLDRLRNVIHHRYRKLFS